MAGRSRRITSGVWSSCLGPVLNGRSRLSTAFRGPRWVCLGNADGTCPQDWIEDLKQRFEQVFGPHVTINEPFRGGYITRTHAAEMPWVQLELSRALFATNAEKCQGVLSALGAWVTQTGPGGDGPWVIPDLPADARQGSGTA